MSRRAEIADGAQNSMVLVEFLGQLFQVVNGLGTTPQRTIALGKAPQWAGATSAEELARAMTGPQLDALIEMAQWVVRR